MRGERREWCRFRDAHLCSKVADGGRKAHPYDVLHVDVIAEEPFFVVINIDDSHQTVTVLPEVIQERRVLTHGRIAVGWIVAGRLIIAEEHDDTLANQLFQFGTTPNIGIFIEHKT